MESEDVSENTSDDWIQSHSPIVAVHEAVPVRTLGNVSESPIGPSSEEYIDMSSSEEIDATVSMTKRRTLESLPFLENLDDSRGNCTGWYFMLTYHRC